MTLRFSTMILMALCLSCSQQSVESPEGQFEYQEELERYLKEVHNIESVNYEQLVLFMIPIGSCSPCVEVTLGLLGEKVWPNTMVGIMGNSEKSFQFKDDLIEEVKVPILFDTSGEYNRYRTSIGAPVLIVFEESKIVYYDILSAHRIPQTREDLQLLIKD